MLSPFTLAPAVGAASSVVAEVDALGCIWAHLMRTVCDISAAQPSQVKTTPVAVGADHCFSLRAEI